MFSRQEFFSLCGLLSMNVFIRYFVNIDYNVEAWFMCSFVKLIFNFAAFFSILEGSGSRNQCTG